MAFMMLEALERRGEVMEKIDVTKETMKNAWGS